MVPCSATQCSFVKVCRGPAYSDPQCLDHTVDWPLAHPDAARSRCRQWSQFIEDTVKPFSCPGLSLCSSCAKDTCAWELFEIIPFFGRQMCLGWGSNPATACHTLLHMAPQCFDHSDTWADQHRTACCFIFATT